MSDWATYLLKRVPEGLKADIAYEAAAHATSHANVVRSILCDHFGLECAPARAYLQPPFKPDGDTLFIRMQPPLFAALRAEASRNTRPQRDVILAILSAHYSTNGK